MVTTSIPRDEVSIGVHTASYESIGKGRSRNKLPMTIVIQLLLWSAASMLELGLLFDEGWMRWWMADDRRELEGCTTSCFWRRRLRGNFAREEHKLVIKVCRVVVARSCSSRIVASRTAGSCAVGLTFSDVEPPAANSISSQRRTWLCSC
jgi:hypothetical protein